MKRGRLEAFSDGVIAIIITIMVLEFKVPEHGQDLSSLIPLAPFFLSYILSFIYVGIFWNNHHHMLYVVNSINGSALWANMFLLFWLSLIPFGTEWMAANQFAKAPVAVYGFLLFMCGAAYRILAGILARHGGEDSELAKALGEDWKGKFSSIIYVIAIVIAFWFPTLSCVLYAVVACIWFVPDRRIEKKVIKR